MRHLMRIGMLSMLPLATFARDKVEMADVMRSNGKIYVVVGVISIIFIGLAIYLIALDRRLTRLERKEKH